jgi:hypothetical protein
MPRGPGIGDVAVEARCVSEIVNIRRVGSCYVLLELDFDAASLYVDGVGPIQFTFEEFETGRIVDGLHLSIRN